MKPEWKSKQTMDFSGIRGHLTNMASALRLTIDAEKKKLAELTGVRDSYKK